jgi:tetratricopeptide (TPR) repeat protein
MSAWMRSIGLATLVVTMLALFGSAVAQTTEQLDTCNGKNNATPEMSIAGCTAVIQTGRYRGNNLASVYFNRGNAYVLKSDFVAAIADYDQTVQINPKHAAAFNNRGLASAGMKKYDQAIKDYDAAISIDPIANHFYNRAGAYIDRGGDGDYDRAIADYDQSIRLNAKFAAAYNNRGLANANLRRYDQAIADYSMAIQLEPSAIRYYNRALAKREKEDVSGSEVDIAEAKKIEPNIAEKFKQFGEK